MQPAVLYPYGAGLCDETILSESTQPRTPPPENFVEDLIYHNLAAASISGSL